MQFRVFDIPVRVRWSFLLVAVLLNPVALRDPRLLMAWVFIVFSGVFIHELGHALAYKYIGASPTIELHAFGGATSVVRPTAEQSAPHRRLFVSLAGPAAGLSTSALILLAASFAGLSWRGAMGAMGGSGDFAHTLLWFALFVNAGWSVLNMLPILPLDGGAALAAFIDIFTKEKGRFVAYAVSVVVGAVAIWFAIDARMYIAALMLSTFVFAAVRGFREELRIGPDRSLFPLVAAARTFALQGDRESARRVAEELLVRARTDLVKTEALHVLGWDAVHRGDFASARAYLDKRSKDSQTDLLLEGIVLIHERQRERGLARLELAFPAPVPSADAVVAAAVLAMAGEPELALGWLGKARAAGFDDRTLLDDATELENVRALPQWPEFRRNFA